MRLVDYFVDVIVFAREVNSAFESTQVDFDNLKEKLVILLQDACANAEKTGFSHETVIAAQFPVVAYIDELILCSSWPHKAQWQKESLQRKFYDTTNIGAEFYKKLNELSKHGPDESVREVYVLCLGLGFKGRYFSTDDRPALEEIKDFNIALLLPEEAQRRLDTATLFPMAYSGHSRDGAGHFKSRFNIFPIVIGVPVMLSLSLILYYKFNVTQMMDQIIRSVN